MQLLQDVFIIEQLQVLSEGKQNNVMKIRGVFGRCNEKNNNGRIYPTAVVASQLEKVQPLIAERRLCGELDHPQNDTVKLSNASHLITKLDMKGDELIGEAEILKTPAGLTAKALVDGGVRIGISSRGMGTLSEDQNGDKIVNEDYRLVTFDLVADPSTRGAYPGLAESTESKFVRESQAKLKKESTFVTLLNSKLRDAYQPWIDEAKSSDELHSAGKSREAVERREERLRRLSRAIEKSAKPKKEKDIDEDAKKGYPKKGIKPGTKEAKEEEAKRQAEEDIADQRNRPYSKKDEAFKLVKADGHWHRIAEAILNGLGEGRRPHRAGGVMAGGKWIPTARMQDYTPAREKAGEEKETAKEVDVAAKLVAKKKAEEAAKKKAAEEAKPKEHPGQGKLPLENASTVYQQVGKLFLETMATEVERSKERSATELHGRPAASDTGGMMSNLRARSHAKGMEVAKARGARKGARELAKGDVEGERIRARGAAGGSVSKNPFSPGRQSYAQGTRALQQRQERIQRSKERLAARGGGGSAPAPGKGSAPAPAEAPPKSKEKGLPDLPPGTERIAPEGKGIHPLPRGTEQIKTSPTSKSGRNINPDLQRRLNLIKSKQGESRQSMATTRKRLQATGKLKRTGEGGDISASRAYKQIGSMLAEMLDLTDD